VDQNATMNEKEQAEFYDDQRARGSGAFMRKQGLGFAGPPGCGTDIAVKTCGA